MVETNSKPGTVEALRAIIRGDGWMLTRYSERTVLLEHYDTRTEADEQGNADFHFDHIAAEQLDEIHRVSIAIRAWNAARKSSSEP